MKQNALFSPGADVLQLLVYDPRHLSITLVIRMYCIGFKGIVTEDICNEIFNKDKVAGLRDFSVESSG